jgi:hypothetical protein
MAGITKDFIKGSIFNTPEKMDESTARQLAQ